jgi:hypothetical protein
MNSEDKIVLSGIVMWILFALLCLAEKFQASFPFYPQILSK